jgi:hypothetical protein
MNRAIINVSSVRNASLAKNRNTGMEPARIDGQPAMVAPRMHDNINTAATTFVGQ